MPEAMLLGGFEQRLATIRGKRVRYAVGGDGPPVVLVHGLGGAAENWSGLAALLACRHRVLVPNLWGHGGSEAVEGAASLAAFADQVALCAEREELPPAAFVGHSLGGAVVLSLALRRPEAVSAVVLAAAAGISSSSLRNRIGLAVTTRLRPARLAARIRGRVVASSLLRRAVFYGMAEDPSALTEEAVLGFLAGAGRARDTRTAARAMLAEEIGLGLESVACPTLVLWGARDRILPLEDGFEYARRLRAPLRVLPKAGHLLIGERPKDCCSLVEEFLDEVMAAERGAARPAVAR